MRHGLAPASFAELLGWRAAEQPHRTAFTWPGNGADHDITISYVELARRARAVAGVLQQAGPPGERALLVFPPGLDFVAALFGCLYAGWIAVPAYPPPLNQHLERVLGISRDAQPRIALTSTESLDRLQPRLDAVADLARLRWQATDHPPSAALAVRPADVTPEAVAVLQYTSGSTAAPRGVMLTHANLLHNASQIQQRFEASQDSLGVIWLPPYHDMGLIGGILEGVYAGFPIALMAPVAFLQRPRRWLEAITRTRATISGGPNFAYDLCVDRISPEERDGLDLTSWQVAFNGSEPVRATTLQRFADAFGPYGFASSAFYPCYGLAEATLMVSGGWAKAPPVITQRDDGGSIVGCGHSLDDQELVVVDPLTHSPSGPGEVGEIWISGPSVAAGYWRQPGLTAETFAARLPDGRGPYLRTGDLGCVGSLLRHDESVGHRGGAAAEPQLFITGRIKATLVVGGRKIQAEDIEGCLVQAGSATRPAVVVALSIGDVDAVEQLVVVHETDKHHTRHDFESLARSIRARIAEAHQVRVSSVVLTRRGGVPRTSSGKVQRTACRDALLTGKLDKVYEWKAPWS